MKTFENAVEETRETITRRTVLCLISTLVLSVSIAVPPQLRAELSHSGNALSPDLKQSAPLGDGKDGNRPPAQPGPPRNGEDQSQGKPERPDPRLLPGAPQNGGSPVKPGRPVAGAARPLRPTPHSGPRPTHPPAHHPLTHGHGYPSYAWGAGNRWRLHQFFLGDFHRVNRWHRHQLFVGGYFPRIVLSEIQPIPPDLMFYLPPVPPGYAVGYYDGYCLLYDPFSLRIVSVIDLYRE
jgi:hypothetical protein